MAKRAFALDAVGELRVNGIELDLAALKQCQLVLKYRQGNNDWYSTGRGRGRYRCWGGGARFDIGIVRQIERRGVS
jgi:hypothetical protein